MCPVCAPVPYPHRAFRQVVLALRHPLQDRVRQTHHTAVRSSFLGIREYFDRQEHRDGQRNAGEAATPHTGRTRSQGTSLLSLIQSLFGSSGNEPNISGDSSMETCPVCRLYILSPPVGARFLARIPRFLCIYYIMYRALDVVFSMFWVFSGDTNYGQSCGQSPIFEA